VSDEKADELIAELERLNKNLDSIEEALRSGLVTVETI